MEVDGKRFRGKFGKFGTSTRVKVIESSSEILKFLGKKFLGVTR